jgi:putative phosphoribosyl transferase
MAGTSWRRASADERPFADRQAAGFELAARVADDYGGREDVTVLGLPRGGVPVAAAIASRLGAPLDVLLVRKLRHPRQPELAIGAVASGGVLVRNESLLNELALDDAELAALIAVERAELDARERRYRGDRPTLLLRHRVAVLVDDGVATGASMRSAVAATRRLGAAEIVVAVPVGSTHACHELADTSDVVVCLRTPARFHAVGQWYRDFRQTTDEQVIAALQP